MVGINKMKILSELCNTKYYVGAKGCGRGKVHKDRREVKEIKVFIRVFSK